MNDWGEGFLIFAVVLLLLGTVLGMVSIASSQDEEDSGNLHPPKRRYLF